MSDTRVSVEINPWYRVNKDHRRIHIADWLAEVDEIQLVETDRLPALCIGMEGRVIAAIDPWDGWELAKPTSGAYINDIIRDHDPTWIFKYQFRAGVEYPPGTVAAGFPCHQAVDQALNLATRERPIAVSARMRVNNDYWWKDDDWMFARTEIVEQARTLGAVDGLEVRTGMIEETDFLAELWDTKVGFDWRGAGVMTHRSIEYIRAGVVPILYPLTGEWPIREDVVLEDDVHCVYGEPGNFAQQARELLADPQRIDRIRRNVLELWETKLCPRAQGYWLWGKLQSRR